MALISDTATGALASAATDTMVSTKAQHSPLPVANNARNDRMRDMSQSNIATAHVGLPSMRLFAWG